jgi:hypothetical protein
MSKASDSVKIWRKRNKERIVLSMGGKCQCCNYNKCNEALEMHHLDPSKKDFSFGAIRANPSSWLKIVEELKKCILLCANCHREIHAGIKNVPENYSTFDTSYVTFKIPDVDHTHPCPICGINIPDSLKYCSLVCSGKSKRKVDWNSVDLVELLKTKTISDIAETLDVSWNAVKKRMKKLEIIYKEKDIIVAE